MFDFLGAVQITNHANANCRPFKHLYEIGAVNFSETRLSFNGQSWWLLDQGKHATFFQDDHLLLLLHGNCYPNLYSNEIAARGRLMPDDLAARYRTGKDLMLDVKGSFVIVVIDREKNSLDVFSDPLNLRTVYYTSGNGDLLISTSLTAVSNYLTQTGHPPKIDRRAMLDHYLFDFTLDDHTFLQDVRELGPGSHLHFSNGNLTLSNYFQPFKYFNLRGRKLSLRDGVARVKEVLSDNVQLYSEGPEETAVALTGGFDSRSITALLKDSMSDYSFYSYGKRESWDIKIPQLIAGQLHLKYLPIFLEDDYADSFSEYGKLAVLLSDGAAEFSHANIAYVYSNYLLDKSSILTGLFGSELIKTPSSRGLFLDTNTIEILGAKDPVVAIKSIFERMNVANTDLPFYDKETREEVIEMIRSHPFISNDLPMNEKFFYYVLMVGVRKYFRKETKIQRVWKSNLHPFLDLEFIGTLLQTPFPWVYNFSHKKSLLRNIRIHKLYGSIINEHPGLGDIISTHGFRPRHLLNPMGKIQLAIEYFLNKKNFSAASSLHFQENLSFRMIDQQREFLFADTRLDAQLHSINDVRPKDIVKMSSLQFWLRSIGLGM